WGWKRKSEKLWGRSGTPDQASGGDTFSPTQFGVRCVSAHAFLTASVPLSCICGDVRVSTSAALALRARAKTPASTTVPSAYFIAFSSPLLVLFRRARGRVARRRRVRMAPSAPATMCPPCLVLCPKAHARHHHTINGRENAEGSTGTERQVRYIEHIGLH